jgi:WD40 repeat protein
VRADGALIASSGQDGTVALWDATSLAERMRLPGDAPWIEHVAFQPKGTLLASAGGKHLKLWASDGRLVHATSAHPSTIAAIAWDAAGRQIGLAAYGGLWIHGVAGAKLATRSLAWQGAALTVAWSPSGKVIASGMQDGTVHFWRAGERVSAQMSGYPGKVRETSWSASGRYLATGGGAQITVWDFRGKGPEGTRPIQLD